MKRSILQKLIFTICLLTGFNASAYKYYFDGIYYNIDYRYSNGTGYVVCLEVTYCDINNNENAYTGELTIPSSFYSGEITYKVTSIGSYAFYNCKHLTGITIPETVNKFNAYAFYGNHELCSITIDSNNETYYSSGNAIIESATKTLVAGCKSTIIPYGVTAIGDAAFRNCGNLANITIPNSVTSIGTYAFCELGGLESITIPSSVTTIDDFAFYDCDGLESITIPGSVTSIGHCIFGKCSNLKTIIVESDNTIYDSRDNCNAIIETATNRLIAVCPNTKIPDSVTTIGSGALRGFDIISFTIPDGITTVETGALPDLKSLTVSSSVQNIGKITATKTIWQTNTPPTGYENVTSKRHYVSNDQYTKLSNVTIYPYLSSIFEVDGVKYVPVSPSERTCDAIDCTYDSTVTDINIGNSVAYRGIAMTLKKIKPYTCYDNDFIENVNIDFNDTIPEYAFYSCGSVTEAKIRTPKIIDKYAFQNCTNLEIAEINATTIGNQAFSSCSTSNPATFEINANFINDHAFASCRALESAKIMADSIGEAAFYNCATKTAATFDLSARYLSNKTFMGCSMLENISVSDLEHICDSVFYDCTKLQTIAIPNTVRSLGAYAFYNCNALTQATIGNSVPAIKDYTFSKCQSISEIIIPESVTAIGNYVFSGCSSLANVTFDNRETTLSLGSNGSSPLFADCPLKSVYIGGDITYDTTADHGYSPFYSNTCLESVTIVDREDEISEYEFYGCSSLNNISMGNGVVTIGDYALMGCTNLQSITIPNATVSLGRYAFSECSSLNRINIGTGLSDIKNYSFSGCSSLSEITIPENVTTIGNYVFSGCSSLADVTFADRETELVLGSNGSNPLFADCPLRSIYIGGNISYPTSSKYGYSPFYRNTALETVTITDKETEISANEFYGCSALKSITMGNGVETIGNWAFSGCSSLDYFEFGSGMQTIGEEAFSDCTAMTTLISRATVPPTCGTQALDDINKWNCELTVPEESLSAYQSADQWKEFFFITSEAENVASDVIGNLNIAIENGNIVVRGAGNEPIRIEVYDINGNLIYSGYDSSIPVAAGIYIVKTGNTSHKVVI